MLHAHGCVSCNKCFSNPSTVFNVSKISREGWRITNNPMAWGESNPEVIVLGFSKGPTQAKAVNGLFNDIPYKGSRSNIGKIFAHVGLIEEQPSTKHYSSKIDSLINESNGRFHFGSLVKCTVEKYNETKKEWAGSGNNMLGFVATDFGKEITNSCVSEHLGKLPSNTKLIVIFGMGTNNKYTEACFKLFQDNRPGNWERINKVSYTDGKITVVHVEHFASQGPHLSNWLGINEHPRKLLGEQAQQSASRAVKNNIS